jgi:hypothetical protein
MKCEVYGSHNGVADDLSPLGCYAMSTGKEILVFRGVRYCFHLQDKQFQNSEVAVPVGAVFNCEVPPGVSTHTGTD